MCVCNMLFVCVCERSCVWVRVYYTILHYFNINDGI